jgi:hypothetical protein
VTSPDLKLSPTSATNPTGTSHTITATVTLPGTSTPSSGSAVTFVVASGPNTGAKGTCTFSNGSGDAGCVTGSDGKVLFTYHDAGGAGTDTIAASVTLSGTTEHASATKTWDPAITATGTPVKGTEAQAFSATVATATDPDTTATASQYSASINWGDGSTSTGTIAGTGGKFTVTGTHTYKDQGSFTVKVTITDTDAPSNSASATSTATIGDAALHASRGHPSKSGLKVRGTLGTFTDDNPNAKATDYKVRINWGDGKTSNGTVKQAAGHFAVTGSHTYGRPGTHKITVKIVDDGGSTATVTDRVSLAGHRATGARRRVVAFTG